MKKPHRDKVFTWSILEYFVPMKFFLSVFTHILNDTVEMYSYLDIFAQCGNGYLSSIILESFCLIRIQEKTEQKRNHFLTQKHSPCAVDKYLLKVYNWETEKTSTNF